MKNINMYSRDYKTFLAKDFIDDVSIQNWKYDLEKVQVSYLMIFWKLVVWIDMLQ